MATEGTRLFVGNLSWSTTDESLRAAFATIGPITDAKVIMDNYNGRSRGFGFVTYTTQEDAAKALNDMNGVSVDGREVRVDRASSKNR